MSVTRLTSDQRYNFTSCLVDSAGWTFGMAFFSTSTIVPAFLSKLGANTLLIGILPALITLGYTVPGAFVAARISRLKGANVWLFRVAIAERVPLLLMGLTTLTLQSHSDILWVFLTLYCIHSVILGINQPAYWVVIAKCIPELWRGRLFGFAGLAGGICAVAVLPIAGRLLSGSGLQLIHGFAWCFVVGAGIEFASVIPLGFLRTSQSVVIEDSLEEIIDSKFFGAVWASSLGFRRFILGQALFSVWTIASPFYVLDGISKLHVSSGEIALFAAIGAVSAAFGSSFCGMLSDRKGNRIVLLLASFSGVAASLCAVYASNAAILTSVFVMSAISAAGTGLAGFNITMEFAPTDRAIPHFTAFYNLVLAPIRAAALVVGGLISQNINFTTVFWISAIAAGLSAVSTWQLKEPRHTNRRTHLQEHVL